LIFYLNKQTFQLFSACCARRLPQHTDCTQMNSSFRLTGLDTFINLRDRPFTFYRSSLYYHFISRCSIMPRGHRGYVSVVPHVSGWGVRQRRSALPRGPLLPGNDQGCKVLEAKIFRLGLIASGFSLVLGLMPRSHEGCPRGLVVSHRNDVIYVTFFKSSKSSSL